MFWVVKKINQLRFSKCFSQKWIQFLFQIVAYVLSMFSMPGWNPMVPDWLRSWCMRSSRPCAWNLSFVSFSQACWAARSILHKMITSGILVNPYRCLNAKETCPASFALSHRYHIKTRDSLTYHACWHELIISVRIHVWCAYITTKHNVDYNYIEWIMFHTTHLSWTCAFSMSLLIWSWQRLIEFTSWKDMNKNMINHIEII